MSGALSHSKEVELSLSEVDGQPVAALQLAEKHKQLMEISDWATSLKVANAHLNAELGDLKLEVSNIRKSWIFRVIGYLNRRSV